MTDTPSVPEYTHQLVALVLAAHPKRFVAENNFRVALTKLVSYNILIDHGDAEYSFTPGGLRWALAHPEFEVYTGVWPQQWGRAIRPGGTSVLYDPLLAKAISETGVKSLKKIMKEFDTVIFDELAPISARQAASKPLVIVHDQEYARMLKTNARYIIATGDKNAFKAEGRRYWSLDARRERLTRRMEAWGWVFAFAILAGAAVAVTVL